MSSVAVRLRRVSAGYGPVTVLRDVDLHVGHGEVVALLGPNGAGKTTTLLAISGVVQVTAGAIELLGSAPPNRSKVYTLPGRGVVHVPENRGLFSQLTVRENLRLGVGRRLGAIEGALSLFPELEPLQDRRAGLLSGGEQQMLALARALTAEPRLLLLDEMSMGLAPVIVERLMPFARRAADAGAAVVLVEQHTDVALRTADRAYVLAAGEVTLEGDASELLANRERLDAAFLGEANGSAP